MTTTSRTPTRTASATSRTPRRPAHRATPVAADPARTRRFAGAAAGLVATVLVLAVFAATTHPEHAGPVGASAAKEPAVAASIGRAPGLPSELPFTQVQPASTGPVRALPFTQERPASAAAARP